MQRRLGGRQHPTLGDQPGHQPGWSHIKRRVERGAASRQQLQLGDVALDLVKAEDAGTPVAAGELEIRAQVRVTAALK